MKRAFVTGINGQDGCTLWCQPVARRPELSFPGL